MQSGDPHMHNKHALLWLSTATMLPMPTGNICICYTDRCKLRFRPLFTALHLPAASDELRQTSVRQVSAAPQVQRAEEATASGQHTGHDIIVLDLQEGQAAVGIFSCSLSTVCLRLDRGSTARYATLQQPHKILQWIQKIWSV